jgi:ribosomal protein S18 acetylase RimI-like enzyme
MATVVHVHALQNRLLDFQRRVRAAVATRVDTLPFGTVIVSDDLPLIYDQNIILVDAPVAPSTLLDTAEAIAGEFGWAHRNVEIADSAVASTLRDALLSTGYKEERNVTMVLSDEPATPPARHAAVVTGADEQLPLARAMLAEEPWATDEALDQFEERVRRLGHVAAARAVAAPPDAPVSRCLLLTDGAIAEIDEVATLSAYRRRGWSSAVVLRAIEVARDDGLSPVLLVADDEDWPKGWYARLGFRAVGKFSQFLHSPDDR